MRNVTIATSDHTSLALCYRPAATAMTSNPANDQLLHHAALDERLVEVTRGIRLLASVSWPASAELDFIAAWRAGRTSLPEVTYPHAVFAATREALDAITPAPKNASISCCRSARSTSAGTSAMTSSSGAPLWYSSAISMK